MASVNSEQELPEPEPVVIKDFLTGKTFVNEDDVDRKIGLVKLKITKTHREKLSAVVKAMSAIGNKPIPSLENSVSIHIPPPPPLIRYGAYYRGPEITE